MSFPEASLSVRTIPLKGRLPFPSPVVSAETVPLKDPKASSTKSFPVESAPATTTIAFSSPIILLFAPSTSETETVPVG